MWHVLMRSIGKRISENYHRDGKKWDSTIINLLYIFYKQRTTITIIIFIITIHKVYTNYGVDFKSIHSQ